MENYKQPKEFGDEDEITKQLRSDGCAPKLLESEEEDDFVLPKKKVKKGKLTEAFNKNCTFIIRPLIWHVYGCLMVI